MLRLLMIADDFTGALDTGVQLAAHGIPTQVVVGQGRPFRVQQHRAGGGYRKRGICPPQRLPRQLQG